MTGHTTAFRRLGTALLVLLLIDTVGLHPLGPTRLLAQARPGQITLVDASASSGLDFLHSDGSSGQEYLVEVMVAGLALFDYNCDGWIDAYFLNGAALRGATLTDRPVNALYRNNGDGTFTNVTREAGVGDHGYGLGVTAADYDNDGFPDLYVANFGPNVLYHNNGDGTFTDVTDAAGVADGAKFGAGVAFLDIDADGCLDLYSGNYVDFTYERHDQLAPAAYPYPPVPADYPPLPDSLFRNRGDGTFENISNASGIASVARPSMGLICGDFDGDCDSDVYVACDGAPSLLFENDGTGQFTEVAVLVGLAFNGLGQADGMMGPEAGDYDNDGDEDLFVTNYSGQLATLFRNMGPLGFEDVSRTSQAGRPVLPHTNWGSGLVDFDNDAYRDLFISNGHMLKRIRAIEPFTDFRVANCLMANQGDGTFVDITAAAGSGLSIVESSRGTGFDDMDNDGDVDCVILNCCGPANYLENRSENDHHWLQLELRGRQMNRDAVGARVRVVAGDLVQVAEVRSGRAYQSHYGSRLYFGLGNRDRIDRVEVYWMKPEPQVFENIPVDQLTILLEP